MAHSSSMIAETLKISPERATLVEAYLRLEHGTLDHLSRVDVRREYARGISATIDANLEQAIALARSFGLA